MLDKKLQQEIIKKFKGKGGPPDSESSILDNKEDKDILMYLLWLLLQLR